VPDENDPSTWSFILGATWKGNVEDYPDNETRLAAFKEAAEPFCEPFRSVALSVPDRTHVGLTAMNYWVTEPWDNHTGRVTLMGDAAHPMTPS
jgi:2-polyprenyl-6-methoxyphenol hydroxylase-like FAD-dependent oxidoreductase